MSRPVRRLALALLVLLLIVLLWRHSGELLILACEKLGWYDLIDMLKGPGCFGQLEPLV